jgi:glycosyltransferase involved in cell wall biosynthesis
MTNISLIVVTKNNAKELALTLNSIATQTYSKNIELIIVNGGRAISYKKLIIVKKKFKVHQLRDKKDGIFSAMNEGAKKANGKHLLFLNSGDRLINDNILKVLFKTNLKNNYNYLFICRVIGKYYHWHIPNNTTKSFGKQRNVNVHQSILFKKSFYKNVKYNENYNISADYDVKFKMIQKSKNMFIPYVITEHKLGGVSSSYNPRNYLMMVYELFKIDSNNFVIGNLILNQIFLFIKFILTQTNNKKILEKFLMNKYKGLIYEIKI